MPKLYKIEYDSHTVVVQAKDKATAQKEAAAINKLRDDMGDPDIKAGKLVNVEELTPPKPDNTVEKQGDNGFYFPAWGIHVIAASQKDAKQIVKDGYGIDVDKDPPPAPDEVEAGREELARATNGG